MLRCLQRTAQLILALPNSRLALSKKLDEALAPVKILASNRLPRAVAAVDYAPYVRRMVALDDLEQHAHEQSLAAARAANNGTEGSHSSRSTRNSTRLYTIAGSRSGDYERWLPLDADAQHSARETFLW